MGPFAGIIMPRSTGAGRAALAASIHSLRPLASHRTSCKAPSPTRFESGAMASACHWCCSSVGTSVTRGNDAQATPLHSSAIAPALFHPPKAQGRRGKAGASARALARRPNRCAWVCGVNTDPVSRIEVKTGLKLILPGTGRWQAEGLTEGVGALHDAPSTMFRMVPLPVPGRNWNLAFSLRAATFGYDGGAFRRSGPGDPRADQHGQDLSCDRADVRPLLGSHRIP